MLSQVKASNKYDKVHTERVSIKLNKKHDKDILDKLKSVPNKQGYIKTLIRKDIAEGNDGEIKARDIRADDGNVDK